jgi:Glycosyl transferase 4-like domain
MAADVLYITFDGVLQPLAYSQVVRVVGGLAKRGLKYHLLSVARPGDLAKPELTSAVNDVLRPAGVGWTSLTGGSMSTAARAGRVVARVTREAAAIARSEGIKLVHARGYQSAAVARALKALLGLPYLFDARGYWIEERSGSGGWFSTAGSYAMGKLVEQVLFRGAHAVVTLTSPQAADVASGLFGPPPRLLEVIPTCADYDAFYLRDSRPAKPDGGGSVPDDVKRRLAGKTVLGVVGALNGTYSVRETLALAKLATQMNPEAHLLVLSAQHEEYQAAIASVGIPLDRHTLATADHWSMPDWLQWIDWGLLLIPESAANRAKMPTKLAEFFATGVRPIFFGCNSDASSWVERAGSGHVLRSMDEAALRAAARATADPDADCARLRAAREVTAPHFSLASGLDRYRRFVGDCLSGRQAGSAPSPVYAPPHKSSLSNGVRSAQ